MMRRALMVLVLCWATSALGTTTDEALMARAKVVQADRKEDPKTQGPRLVAYADSLRSVDIVLAVRCLEVAGIAAFGANELDSAVTRWQRGVDWAREAGVKKSESSLLNALAIGHTARGDFEAALPVYDRCLELREALNDTIGSSRTWGNLATAYANINRLPEALAATAEEERWLALVNNPVGRVGNAIRRVQLLSTMGRFDEALLLSDEAVALAAEFGDEQAQGLAAMKRGNVLLDLGRPEEAFTVLTTAADLLRRAQDSFAATFVDQSLVQCLLRLDRPEEALVLIRTVSVEVEAAGQLPLLTVLRRYEGNALFALGRIAAAESTLVTALSLFEARREDLEDDRNRAGIFLASGEIYASLARCQLVTGRIEEAFLTVERGRAANFRDHIGGEVPGSAALVAALRETRGALILFNDPAYDPLVAFILDGKGLRTVELGSVDPLATDAQAALRLLAAGESLATCRPALARLEQLLAVPILAAVDPEVERFAVVPPAFLAGFPLGILQDGEGRAWSESRPLSYLPNASALLALGARTAPPEGVLALADPAAPSGPLGRLPVSPARAQVGVPLPEARAEIAIIALKKRQRRVGAAASGQALRDAMLLPLAVLHLATHAVVDPLDGGRSAVVLAGPDGVETVTAREIATFDFQGDLVVLSGCSTFGEHRILGEGWFGLPRSFLAAGARTVVSTLWDVDDSGARQFVTAFYVALRNGAARDEALLLARDVCRDAGMPPREWAAFVLTGVGSERVSLLADGGQTRERWLLLILALILAVGATGILLWRR